MGEYALYNKKEVKIGTCEEMFYLRYEDRFKVSPLAGNVNPHTAKNLFWRLPLPSEDYISPGHYPSHTDAYIPLQDLKLEWEGKPDPGIVQLTHPCGLLVNVACYHGVTLPEGNSEFRAHWNGKASYFFDLKSVKNTRDGVFPIVGCRFCRKMYRTDWETVLPHIKDETLKNRLAKYDTGDSNS